MSIVPPPLPAPGASGNVLTSDGSWWASAAPSGGGGTVSAAGWRPKTGQWYGVMATTAATTVSTGFLVIVPFVPLAVDTTFDRISCEIVTGAASSTVNLCVFELTNGWPAARTLDAGAVDSSTTGQKDITISQTLLASKQYAVGALILGGSPQLRGHGATALMPFMPWLSPTATSVTTSWQMSGQASVPSSAASATAAQAALTRVVLRAA